MTTPRRPAPAPNDISATPAASASFITTTSCFSSDENNVSASTSIQLSSMLAAEWTMPFRTTDGSAIPTGPSHSKCRTRSTTTSATASGFAGCGVGIRNRSTTSWPDSDIFTGAAFIPLPPMSIPNPICEVTGTNTIDQALALVLRSTGSASASARSANDSTRPAAPGVSPSTRLPITCRVMFAIE